MDVDDLKAELSVAIDGVLNTAELLAASVEAGDDDALHLVSTLRAQLRCVRNLRREIVTEVQG